MNGIGAKAVKTNQARRPVPPTKPSLQVPAALPNSCRPFIVASLRLTRINRATLETPAHYGI